MQNTDVYAIVSHSSFSALLRVSSKENKDLLAFVPVKIQALCGHEIRSKGNFLDKLQL